MTNSFPTVEKYTPTGIGIENLFRVLDDEYDASRRTNYPFCNVYTNKDRTQYNIEIAVSGFSRDEITVSLERSVLEIAAAKNPGYKLHLKNFDKDREYLQRTLAFREFNKKFVLDQDMVVQSVHLSDGVLYITIVREVPEHLQRRVLQISEGRDRTYPVKEPSTDA